MEQTYFGDIDRLGTISQALRQKVTDYEIKHQIRLPAAYTEFVARGGDIVLDVWMNVNVYTEFGEEMIKSTRSIVMQTGAEIGDFFPFATNPETIFWFFYLTEGDNPPVYAFGPAFFFGKYIPSKRMEKAMENLPKGIAKVADSFTEFIHRMKNKDGA